MVGGAKGPNLSCTSMSWLWRCWLALVLRPTEAVMPKLLYEVSS